MLVDTEKIPGKHLYYWESYDNDDIAHRYLSILVAERLVETNDEVKSYNEQFAIEVIVEDPHHLAALEILVEGPHSGTIVECYIEELKLIGFDAQKVIDAHYADHKTDSEEDEASQEYEKLFNLSCELMFRSLVKLTYGEAGEIRDSRREL